MPRQARCRTVDWSWEEFLNDGHVQGMGAEALGLWVRVLGALASSETPGRIRGDEGAIRRASGADAGEWERCRGYILAPLIRLDGVWVHKRTERGHEEQTSRVAAAKKRTEKAREMRRKQDCDRGPTEHVTGTVTVSVTGQGTVTGTVTESPLFLPPSPKDNTKNGIAENGVSKKEGDGPEGFRRFWELYPNKVARPACLAKWKTQHLEARSEEVIAGLEQWKQSTRWKTGFVCDPHKFLNQAYWAGPPPKETAANCATSDGYEDLPDARDLP